MSEPLPPADVARDFVTQLEQLSGARILACLQCKKCTSGCPVAQRADLRAHEIIRLAQLGDREELLGSRMIWECTSCQTCSTRCPQRVDIAALNDALRRMSRSGGGVNRKTTLPTFNDAFLRSVRRRGRVYEVGLMATYKLRTLRLFEDLDQLPTMVKKGKLRWLPTSVPGRSERRRIWKRVAAAGGRNS
jgi:heterodisulfide reductase subunit C2